MPRNSGGAVFLNFTAVPVPEPALVLTVCLAGFAAGYVRRRRVTEELARRWDLGRDLYFLNVRDLVWRRAGSICEYCRMPQAYDPLSFEVDHVVAEKHHGRSVASNLAS